MLWKVKIGQGINQRIQDRIINISITHDSFMQSFSIIIKNPTWVERSQSKGRIDDAIIQIKRGSEILIEGFIENVECGADNIILSGRSFLVLLGYSTSSETDDSGNTKAEYENATGSSIITNLITNFCYTKDSELTYTDITFTETYDGVVKFHGKKVYQIIKEMCSSYGKDIWSDATWNGDGINIDNKNIHIGERSRESFGSPHKVLRGGQHLKDIPSVKYKTGAEMMNCLRVIGKGEGKEQVSVWCEDLTSIGLYGYIEGQPYRSNMITKESTAKSIGNAIIAAKKDPITQLSVSPAYYISDLKYGDWVQIIDTHSNIDTVKRIKKIVYIYTINQIDSMQIELGDKFNNYENIIADLTKGDVDAEKEMTLAGGSFRITANTPPNTYIRIEKGSWYGTDGIFYVWDIDTTRVFWGGNPPYNATTPNNYFKALIQIKNNALSTSDIEYKTSLTSGAHTGYNQSTAEGEIITPDDGYTPLGEIILKCQTSGGTVYPVEATDETGSYIWRDVRPIIGSSATGFGGEGLWENIGSPEYSQLIVAQNIYLQGYDIRDTNAIKNELGSNFTLYGSNSAHTDFLEILQWDHDEENLGTDASLFTLNALGDNVSIALGFYRGAAGSAQLVWSPSHTHFQLTKSSTEYATIDIETLRLNSNTAYELATIQVNNSTGNLEFWDNIIGTKTLTELANVAGLWEDMGTYVRLIAADDIDLQNRKIINLDAATLSGDAISLDVDGYVPINNIPLGAPGIKGDLLVGKFSGCEEMLIGPNTYVLTADSGVDFGMKWAPPAVSELWEDMGTYVRLIAADDIDLQNERIYFNRSISNSQIYGIGDNLIINPHSTTSNIGFGGILSATYGIINCGNIAMSNDRSITNCDGITMYDSGSILDMNYGSIVDSGDITLYDSTSLSPKLSLKVPFIESSGGVYLIATDNRFFINKIDNTPLISCNTGIGEWTITGNLNVYDINMSVGNIIGVVDIKSYYSTGIEIKDSSGNGKIELADLQFAAICNDDIDMDHNDIIDCRDIKGDTGGTNGAYRLNLDFRGDAAHRIYYTGISDNRLGYKTSYQHAFAIGANVITTIDANGLLMNTGKYIKSVSGDLELRAPSGSKIKFVIG